MKKCILLFVCTLTCGCSPKFFNNVEAEEMVSYIYEVRLPFDIKTELIDEYKRQ